MTKQAESPPSPDTVCSLLGLILEDVPDEGEVATWNPQDQQAAINWAGANHMKASDNLVDVPSAPQVLVLWAKERGVYLPHAAGFTQKATEAVCALVIRGDKILAVGRRHDHSQFGLPGGKLDPEDSLEEAVLRELVEETGIEAKEEDIYSVFGAYCEGEDKNIWTTTFFVANFTGEPEQGDAGPVEWVTKDVLLAGPFGDYNKKLFQALNRVVGK